MPNYQPLTVAAENLQISEGILLEFQLAGWIAVAIKDDRPFVSKHDEYRARFILHLRRKLALSDEQIDVVLRNEKPPYSLDRVRAILALHADARAAKQA